MVEEVVLRLSPKEAADKSTILAILAQKLRVEKESINSFRIVKRSIDARKRLVFVQLQVKVYLDQIPEDQEFPDFEYPFVGNQPQVIVVGAGPAGLFAALRLVELGLKPVVVERGKNVRDRKKDLAQINRDHIVDPDSNYGFGEGGAGTYSDGKLYTRSKKRGNLKKILEVFVFHGADPDILVDAHPHIGTDKLPRVIENIRNKILECGGEVHFQTRMTDLILKDQEVRGIQTHDGKEFLGPVILATGHSARDVYQILHDNEVHLESKSFAMGVRIEHPQTLIDQIQYHNPRGRGQYLPAASYSFVTQVKGRGVYSFCMCPGGFIVPAATGPEQVVVNGMSPSQRNSPYANSGIVVEIRPEDLKGYEEHGAFAGLQFQKELEYQAYVNGGCRQTAPAQRMGDFVNGRVSNSLPSTSYVPGVKSSPMHEWLPSHIGKRLQEGFRHFGRKGHGYLTNDALLLGVESRTSSPVRIPRDRVSNEHVVIKGLYPCGEGAGFAGGIVSSAMDGERCAESIAAVLKPHI